MRVAVDAAEADAILRAMRAVAAAGAVGGWRDAGCRPERWDARSSLDPEKRWVAWARGAVTATDVFDAGWDFWAVAETSVDDAADGPHGVARRVSDFRPSANDLPRPPCLRQREGRRYRPRAA